MPLEPRSARVSARVSIDHRVGATSPRLPLSILRNASRNESSCGPYAPRLPTPGTAESASPCEWSALLACLLLGVLFLWHVLCSLQRKQDRVVAAACLALPQRSYVGSQHHTRSRRKGQYGEDTDHKHSSSLFPFRLRQQGTQASRHE